MDAGENSSKSLMDIPVLIGDDSRANSQERTTTSTATEKADSVSLSSTETHIRDLTESEVALSNVKNKQLSESEIALRNLESKLKEVQTKLNLETPENSSTSQNDDKEPSVNEVEKESESAVQGLGGTEEPTNEPTTPKALRLNVELARQNQLKDDSENANTPQKQVAEAWRSVGLQRCRFCKFSTDNDSLFKQHTGTCTPKVSLLYSGGVYTCETCDLTWTIKGEFEEHIVCHTTDEPYVCLKCKKVFKSRLLTEQHAKSDHNPNDGAIYGLRGMKKSRKIVEELKRGDRFQFRGKIDIPPTPRNKQVVGLNDGVTSNVRSDEVMITGEQTSQVVKVVNSTTSESRISATSAVATTVNSISSPVDTNSALIEQKMEQMRQYIISTRGGGVLESKGQSSGNQSSLTNDAVKVGQTKDIKPSAQIMMQSASVSDAGVTIHYQPSSKPASLVTKPPETLPTTILLSPISQPMINQTYNPSTNVLNISGPPIATVTHSQSFAYNPKPGQTFVTQPPRQYQFSEYVFPPPPRPRIPVASVAPSPVLQTSIQTTVKSSPTQIPPAAVQANLTPCFLFPIGFNTPNDAASNILIPVAPGNQSTQKAVHNTISYSVASAVKTSNTNLGQNTVSYHVPAPASQQSQQLIQPTIRYPVAASASKPVPQVVQTKVTYPGPMVQHMVRYPVQIATQSNNNVLTHSASKQTGQQVSLISSVSPSNSSVMVNSLATSKPQVVFTTNANTTQSLESRVNQTSQDQNLRNTTAQNPTSQHPSVNNAGGNTDKPVSSSVNVIPVTPVQIDKPADTAFISSTTKHQIGSVPTVEISVLPEKAQDQPSHGSKVNESTGQQGTQYNLSKRYLFRIKPGHGFVCEACRKFTQDEVIFRRHVWDHFHTVTRSCKFCTPENVRRKDFMNCNLVSNVVCSLVKKSANQSKTVAKENAPGKTISVVDDEVIAISDDEEETKKTRTTADDEQEIIVVDEEDPPQKQDTEIKISSTYSLSEQETKKSSLTRGIIDDLKKENTKNIEPRKFHLDRKYNSDAKEEKPKLSGTALSANKETEKDSLISNSEQESAKNTEKRHSKNEKHVGRGKEREIINRSVEANIKTSDNKVLCEKTGMAASVHDSSKSTEQAQTESESKQNEKSSSAKLLYASNIASRKFERQILSSRKSSAFYMCGFDQCSFTSLTSQKYKEHLSTNHTGAYNYLCCHCGLKNYTEDAHIRHINSHANSKTFLLFNCPFNPCRYKTNLVHMFRDHVMSHKETGIKCTYCHKNFESVESLVDHLKTNLIKYVSCPHCHFKFQLKDTVAKHIMLAHPDKHRIVTVSSQIVCLERELNFYNAPLAKTMTNEKRDSLECVGLPLTQHEVDATAFLNASEINNEKGTENVLTIPSEDDNELPDRLPASPPPPVLTAVTPDKNKESSSSYSDKTNPEAPRSLVCSKCNFISWNYKLHLQHLSLHETDEPEREKRFVCIYCPKGFDGLNPFKTHVSNHVGKHELKIYGCTLCVFTTSQKCHIIDHCKDNHLGTGTFFDKTELVVSKEASCKYCDYKSRKAEDVHLHEKVVHLNPVTRQNKDDKAKTQVDEQNSSQQTGDTETTTESVATSESSDQSQKFRKYHCHYCMNYFKHKADLKEHMQISHLDIESKSFVTFKCKYCHFTSTMKNLIINHIERKHVNEPVRILRRIENIDNAKTGSDETEKRPQRNEEKTIYRCDICELSMESSEKFKKHFADKHANYDSDDKESETGKTKEKETIYIPDGNIFKDPVQCSKCSYSNKLRVNMLRHIKEHPELVPSRDPMKTDQSPTKMTARKSTSKSLTAGEEKRMKNPFTAVKDAVRELDRTDKDNSKILEQLALGGDFLHKKLADCFISLGKEFKCKCCQQKIVKRFVLHRHILNHLHVVFFKCHYCNKGDIEQSLLSGHIQQEHSLKPIKFDYMDVNEVCSEIKDKIRKQTFNEDSPLDVQEVSDNSRNSDDVSAGLGIIRKQIHEADMKGDNEPEECVFKCSRCDYFTKREDNLLRHRKTHMNPNEKKYGCSICAYRALIKSQVMKHMKKIHPNQPMKYKVFGNNSETTVTEAMEKTEEGEEAKPNTTGIASKEKDSKESLKKANEMSAKPDNITVTDAGVFEMKSLYKCKECGEKRNSKWAMYQHFKTSKCHKQWYQCEACAFTNQFKKAITQHAKIRHPGRKVGISELPLSHKIRLIKVPVKQDEQILKNIQAAGNNSHDSPNGEETESQKKSGESSKSEVHKCKVCNNYKSESLSKLQYHMNTKHQGKPIFCSECNYKTPLVKHMINHCSDVHKMAKAKYSTQVQDKKDSGKTVTEDSKEETSNKGKDSHAVSLKKFKCPNCNISKDTPKMLRDHMHIHFDYKPFVCKYCSAKLQYFSNVRRHVNTCHVGKTVKYSMVKEDKIEKKLDEMMEQVCKQREKEVSKMIKNTVQMIKKKSEKRSYELDDEILPPKKKKRPVIETDDDTSQDESERDEPSATKYRVVKEPGTNAKVFQCVKCDFKTDKKARLNGHLGKHAGKKTHVYKCPYCNFTASNASSNVYRHIRNKHKGKPEKVISGQEMMPVKRRRVMNYESSDESSSDESIASEQSGKKMVTLKYFCNVCDFRITGLYHFRQHLAIHKEFTCLRKGSDIESRLSCGYCSYMALDDTDFSVHISNHLDERPYRCGYCEYSGYQRCKIQQHLGSSHPDKEEIILDNKESSGERLKVKQTMLVDFDPQIVLGRIEKSTLNKNQIGPGVWKIESEKTGKQKLTDALSAKAAAEETLSDKKDSPSKPQKKIENLFSLLSRDQKKAVPSSDSKENAGTVSGTSSNVSSATISNVRSSLSSPKFETTANSDSKMEVDGENDDQKDDSTEINYAKRPSSPQMKTVSSENESQKNDSSENISEKRPSSTKFKTVSFTIPSPVKSAAFKTVSIKVPSPIKLGKSLDKSGDSDARDEGSNDIELPKFTGNTLVYGEETVQSDKQSLEWTDKSKDKGKSDSEINTVDTIDNHEMNKVNVLHNDQSDSDSKTEQDEQNEPKTDNKEQIKSGEQEIKKQGIRPSDINIGEMDKTVNNGVNEEMESIDQVVNSQNDLSLEEENLNNSTNKLVLASNAYDGEPSESDSSSELLSQKYNSTCVSEYCDNTGEPQSTLYEEARAETLVNKEFDSPGNVVCQDGINIEDGSLVERDAEPVETEAFQASKNEKGIEEQEEVGDLQTNKFNQENECSKENTQSERELNADSETKDKTSKNNNVQGGNETIQETKNTEHVKGEDYICIESQGFEVFDESQAFVELDNAGLNSDNEMQNIQQISESQPFDCGRENVKELSDILEEDMDQTTNEVCDKKDEHAFGNDEDNEKQDENGIESLRCHSDNDFRSPTVASEIEDISDIWGSRHDSVDGDFKELNSDATSSSKGNASSLESNDNRTNSSIALLKEDKSKVSEIECLGKSTMSVTVSATSISKGAESTEEDSHEDILSKIDSVLLDSESNDKTPSELNAFGPELEVSEKPTKNNPDVDVSDPELDMLEQPVEIRTDIDKADIELDKLEQHTKINTAINKSDPALDILEQPTEIKTDIDNTDTALDNSEQPKEINTALDKCEPEVDNSEQFGKINAAVDKSYTKLDNSEPVEINTDVDKSKSALDNSEQPTEINTDVDKSDPELENTKQPTQINTNIDKSDMELCNSEQTTEISTDVDQSDNSTADCDQTNTSKERECID